MPKIVDHERYRKDLLVQCLALFAEQGYSSITMRQVAHKLGVSTGTLYHYFPSKESILIQLVQELCEQDIARFFAQPPAGETVAERLRHVLTFFLEHYRFYQQQLLLWVDFYQHNQRQTLAEATVDQAFLQEFWQRTRDQLMAYLQLAPETVDFLLVFMDGLLLQCLYGRNQADSTWMEHQIELLLTLLEEQR